MSNFNQQMKMIGQQAKGKGVCHRLDMPNIQVDEIFVVALFAKNGFTVYTPVIDVINDASLQ
ncbi:MAG: hypothetical protein IMZ61_03385 [Planctomycetes bacterium]|nr:hypothetical protein [Planctomycetota bacterium]